MVIYFGRSNDTINKNEREIKDQSIKKKNLPHPLLINVVAIPVFPDRPVLPIRWTVE